MESFLHFPLPHQVLSMADANWGPQDASQSKTVMELPPFFPIDVDVLCGSSLPLILDV
jgi:hypothetical protein